MIEKSPPAGKKKSQDKIKKAVDEITSIFNEDMREEQMLLFTANLYYRYRIGQNPDFKSSGEDEDDIKPPKPEEILAICYGILGQLGSDSYKLIPDTPGLVSEIEKMMTSLKESDPFYHKLLGISARLVHDKRGLQWLLSPQSRLPASSSEIAEVHPFIWLLIQDNVLPFLSPPQLADLYTQPVSRKNAGEILRKQKNPKNSYKQEVTREILRRAGSKSTPDRATPEEIQYYLKNMIHDYKVQLQKLKKALTEDTDDSYQ